MGLRDYNFRLNTETTDKIELSDPKRRNEKIAVSIIWSVLKTLNPQLHTAIGQANRRCLYNGPAVAQWTVPT